MSEPSLAVQKAIFALLSAASLGVAIVDEAALDSAMPYVQIGDDAWTQDDAHASEAGERGWIGVVQVEVWDATTAGRSRIKQLIGQISAALHGAALSVTGFTTNWVRYQSSSTQRADDRPLYRGVVTFEIRIQA